MISTTASSLLLNAKVETPSTLTEDFDAFLWSGSRASESG
jgi:hypothetical protein